MNEIRNCKRCGKAYQSNGFSNTCPMCFAQDEAEFSRIKEYLVIHPFAKIFDVSTNLDISISKIKRYLREGRLEIVEKMNQFLDCEICGRPIQSGKYCDDCYKQVHHDFKSVYTGNAASSKHKISYHNSKDTKLKETTFRSAFSK